MMSSRFGCHDLPSKRSEEISVQCCLDIDEHVALDWQSALFVLSLGVPAAGRERQNSIGLATASSPIRVGVHSLSPAVAKADSCLVT